MLANLFMHYAFDVWMSRNHPDEPFARYADDAVVHCLSEDEAEKLKAELLARFVEVGLELHPTKTRIVYCQDSHRREKYPNTGFDFLRVHVPTEIGHEQGRLVRRQLRTSRQRQSPDGDATEAARDAPRSQD